MRRCVLLCDRILERIDGNHVENRSECLALYDSPVVTGANNGGLDEVTFPWQNLRPTQDLSTSLTGGSNRCLIAFHCAGIDQRTHQRARIQRITDANLPIRVYEPTQELLNPR